MPDDSWNSFRSSAGDCAAWRRFGKSPSFDNADSSFLEFTSHELRHRGSGSKDEFQIRMKESFLSLFIAAHRIHQRLIDSRNAEKCCWPNLLPIIEDGLRILPERRFEPHWYAA